MCQLLYISRIDHGKICQARSIHTQVHDQLYHNVYRYILYHLSYLEDQNNLIMYNKYILKKTFLF